MSITIWGKKVIRLQISLNRFFLVEIRYVFDSTTDYSTTDYPQPEIYTRPVKLHEIYTFPDEGVQIDTSPVGVEEKHKENAFVSKPIPSEVINWEVNVRQGSRSNRLTRKFPEKYMPGEIEGMFLCENEYDLENVFPEHLCFLQRVLENSKNDGDVTNFLHEKRIKDINNWIQNQLDVFFSLEG